MKPIRASGPTFRLVFDVICLDRALLGPYNARNERSGTNLET
jgi:hypothetical protein